MPYTDILMLIGLVTLLFSFFAIGYHLNKKTPLPEGYEIPSLKCSSCSSNTCSYSKVNRVQEIKDEIKKSLEKNNGKVGVVDERDFN